MIETTMRWRACVKLSEHVRLLLRYGICPYSAPGYLAKLGLIQLFDGANVAPDRSARHQRLVAVQSGAARYGNHQISARG